MNTNSDQNNLNLNYESPGDDKVRNFPKQIYSKNMTIRDGRTSYVTPVRCCYEKKNVTSRIRFNYKFLPIPE